MSKISDERLVAQIKMGDKKSETLFYIRYFEYAKKLGSIFYYDNRHSGITKDDFTAVAFSIVPTAIQKYNGTGPFYSYWKVASVNAIKDYIMVNSYSLGGKAYGGVSLDSSLSGDDDDRTLSELYGKADSYYDTSLLDTLKDFIEQDNQLSKDEYRVAIMLIYRQYNIKEIIKATHWNKPKAYRVLASTRAKISDYLKNGYFK